jgi:hypothetical protein
MSTIKWSRIFQSVLLAALLPFLYVIHNIRETFPYFNVLEFSSFLLVQVLVATLLWCFIYLIFRNENKSILITFLLLSVYFFFSTIHLQLKNVFGESSIIKYRYLIPVLFLIVSLLIYIIIRSGYKFNKLVSYLVLVFLIFILTDVAIILYKFIRPLESGSVRISGKNEILLPVCDSCKKPDVYFLVFDEYASSSSLKQNFGYDNSPFDEFFKSSQFKVLNQSHSNYYYTLYCMASMLNMSYLEGSAQADLKFRDMASAKNLIKYSAVPEGFRKNGYEILNYSVFDIFDNSHSVSFSHFIGPGEAMKQNLLPNRVWKDIGWNFRSATDTSNFSAYIDSAIAVYHQTSGAVVQSSVKPSENPRFIYGHFFIPHSPFLFDSTGARRSVSEIEADSIPGRFVRSYLDYLPYVNREIKKIISTIKKNTGGKSVIIAMGDHGLRVEDVNHSKPFYFSNFNAVYLPPPYRMDSFYDNISGVNQFRALFNELFNMKIPYVRDSICELRK